MDNACETEGRIRTAAHFHSHELRFTTGWTRFTLSTTNRSLTIASQRMRSCRLLECCAMLAVFSFRQETEIQSSMSDNYLCKRDRQEASLGKLTWTLMIVFRLEIVFKLTLFHWCCDLQVEWSVKRQSDLHYIMIQWRFYHFARLIVILGEMTVHSRLLSLLFEGTVTWFWSVSILDRFIGCGPGWCLFDISHSFTTLYNAFDPGAPRDFI